MQNTPPQPATPIWATWPTWSWVLAQFGLIGLFLLWPSPWEWSAAAVVLLLPALGLGLAALIANRPGNFNIRPQPKAGGHLVRSGPYRWIRHPMYSALLLAMAALLAASPTLPHGLIWLALAGVLQGKAAVEERLLRQRWSDYAGYCRTTRRFIPGLW